MPPILVVTDIEGTTTPISFVHRVLFPYARAALPALLARRHADSSVAEALDAVEHLSLGRDPLAQLLDWMDADAKVTPLKTLQGIAWRDGYRSGRLVGALYPDVAPALRTWHRSGTRLAVYSSGLGGGAAADLRPQRRRQPVPAVRGVSRHPDRRQARARRPTPRLVRRQAVAPERALFLSDVEAELDAAARSGLLTCQLVRSEDGTQPGRHPVAEDFAAVSALFGLPAQSLPLDKPDATATPRP